MRRFVGADGFVPHSSKSREEERLLVNATSPNLIKAKNLLSKCLKEENEALGLLVILKRVILDQFLLDNLKAN